MYERASTFSILGGRNAFFGITSFESNISVNETASRSSTMKDTFLSNE